MKFRETQYERDIVITDSTKIKSKPSNSPQLKPLNSCHHPVSNNVMPIVPNISPKNRSLIMINDSAIVTERTLKTSYERPSHKAEIYSTLLRQFTAKFDENMKIISIIKEELHPLLKLKKECYLDRTTFSSFNFKNTKLLKYIGRTPLTNIVR